MYIADGVLGRTPHRAEHVVGVHAYLVASFRFYTGVLYTPIYPCGTTGFFEHFSIASTALYL